jgi:hypothetical protein
VECESTRKELYDRKAKKIAVLEKEHGRSSNNQVRPQFHPRLVNLTDTVFDTAEKTLLEKGLKFALPPPPHQRENTITSLVADLSMNVRVESMAEPCGETLSTVPVDTAAQPILRTIKTIKEKIESSNLVISKADKGNSVVVMERLVYDQKMLEFLTNNGGIVNNDFKFSKFNAEVRKVISGSEFIIPPSSKSSLKVMNPIPPRLYGLPKIHKEGIPIRPIVSFNSSPTYKLAKYLDLWFKRNTNFESGYAVKNSVDLIDNISNFTPPPDSILVSFDVASLFPNVPLSPTLESITDILTEANVSTPAAEEFTSLLRTCLFPNFCKFNNKIYQFQDGLPMGSPLSPLISEIFMNRLEREVFTSNCMLTQYVGYWHRYVDDVLCLWTGSVPQLHEFLHFLNSLYPSITFTLEVGGKSINFLDLSITIHEGKHEFEVFRKPTYTDIAIDGSSYCHTSHKHAGFLSMIHRLVSIPLTPKAFKREVDTIKLIAENNHVKLNIDKMIHKKLVSRTLDATTTLPRDTRNNNKDRWIRIPYLGKLSSHISRLLKPLHLRPAFYNVNTLRNHFSRLKDPIPLDEKCGVYRLQCDDCPFTYIGQTGRPLKSRLKEHVYAVSSRQPKNSNFAVHLLASKKKTRESAILK